MSDPFGDSDTNPFLESTKAEPSLNEEEVFGGATDADSAIDPKASVAAAKQIDFETPTGSISSTSSTLPTINMAPAVPPRPPRGDDDVVFGADSKEEEEEAPTEDSLFEGDSNKTNGKSKVSQEARKSKLFDFFANGNFDRKEPESDDDDDDDESTGKKAGNVNDADAPADGGRPKKEERHWYHFWKPSFYQIYFDVDTKDVFKRVIYGLVPFGKSFFDSVSENADFYGPFWISTTLIFLLAICSNLANYVAYYQAGSESLWSYSFYKVSVGVGVFYGFLFLLPLLLWILIHFVVGNKTTYIQVACVYGYSISAFIFATPLCIIPVAWVRWVFTIIAAVDSGLTLAISQWKFCSENRARALIPIIISLLALVALSFTYQLYFFTNVNVPPMPSSSSK